MKKILVGVDGSRASLAALAWACRLAGTIDAEVVEATVFHPHDAETDPARYEELWGETERRLDTDWSPPGEVAVPCRSLLLSDSPNALIGAADTQDADLVVVGTEHHGRFASLHIGSLAHHLARHIERPLAIVPESGATRGFQRLVVGLDGSHSSGDAAHWCADVAVRAEAKVIAAYVFKPPIEWLPESDPRSWFRAAKRDLDHWANPLRDAGASLEKWIVKEPNPVDGLAQTIATADADLAVVGASAIGEFLGVRVGHIPLQLVHQTQIPVVMVPDSSPVSDRRVAGRSP